MRHSRTQDLNRSQSPVEKSAGSRLEAGHPPPDRERSQNWPPDQADKRYRPGVPELVGWGLVAAAFTLLIIQYSLRHNRLLYFPAQDDITYMSDGLIRLSHFYRFGLSSTIINHIYFPPWLSPVTVYMAMAGFALFGSHDWAPYVLNGLFIFVLLLSISWVFRCFRPWHAISAALFALATPMAVMTVNEFRPDLGCGLLTALGIVVLGARPFVESRAVHKVTVGALFGMALLTKPSICLATAGFFGLAMLLAMVRDWIGEEFRSSIGKALGAILLVSAVAGLVALPYYAFAWKNIWHYFATHLMNPAYRKIWAAPGGFRAQTLFYLTGPGGRFLIGQHVYLFAGVLLAGAAAILVRHKRSELASAFFFGGILVITYAVPAITPNKNTFGGATFSYLLLFVSLGLFASALKGNRSWNPRVPWAVAILVLATLLSLAVFRMPPLWGSPGEKAYRISHRFVTDVFDTLMNKLDEAPLGKKRLFITTYGTINYQLLKYLAFREDRSPQEIALLLPPDTTELEKYKQQMDLADLVLASEGGSGTTAPMMPSTVVQDQTLDMVRKRADFVEIRRFLTSTGGYFFLFEKEGPFYGWYKSEGLGRLDGPRPQIELGKFRSGLGPATRLWVSRVEEGKVRLSIRCKAVGDQISIKIKLNNHLVGKKLVRHTDGLLDLETMFELNRGEHQVSIEYSQWDRKGSDPIAVFFERLTIESVKAASPDRPTH